MSETSEGLEALSFRMAEQVWRRDQEAEERRYAEAKRRSRGQKEAAEQQRCVEIEAEERRRAGDKEAELQLRREAIANVQRRALQAREQQHRTQAEARARRRAESQRRREAIVNMRRRARKAAEQQRRVQVEAEERYCADEAEAQGQRVLEAAEEQRRAVEAGEMRRHLEAEAKLQRRAEEAAKQRHRAREAAEKRRRALEAAEEQRRAGEAAEQQRCTEHSKSGDLRTLESSAFLATHKKSAGSKPKLLHQLLAAVFELIHAYANAHGIPSEEADEFFGKLQANALTSGGMAEVLDPQQLMSIAVRLWTSAEDLRGRELCGILNEAIRNDRQPAIEHAAKLIHAINAFCVARRNNKSIVRWPADNKVYRGGSMPREHREFFHPGTTYRAPMYVATSLAEGIAIQFVRRLDQPTADQQPPFQEPLMWVFNFDATLPETLRCVHVNYIDRTDGSVNGEDEMLFAPYSVFTVRSVTWVPNPEVDDYTIEPHIIEVDVAPDNAKAPKALPLAPWC